MSNSLSHISRESRVKKSGGIKSRFRNVDSRFKKNASMLAFILES